MNEGASGGRPGENERGSEIKVKQGAWGGKGRSRAAASRHGLTTRHEPGTGVAAGGKQSIT